LGVALTFAAVTFAWVLFRAGTLGQAFSLWKGMLGLNGAAVPFAFRSLCASCSAVSTQTTGIELCAFAVLLAWCMSRQNAMQAALDLVPGRMQLLRLYATGLVCVFFASEENSFIYWNF
jgi:hypothetical protein